MMFRELQIHTEKIRVPVDNVGEHLEISYTKVLRINLVVPFRNRDEGCLAREADSVIMR